MLEEGERNEKSFEFEIASEWIDLVDESWEDIPLPRLRPRSGERKPHLKLNPAVLGERGNAPGTSAVNNGR